MRDKQRHFLHREGQPLRVPQPQGRDPRKGQSQSRTECESQGQSSLNRHSAPLIVINTPPPPINLTSPQVKPCLALTSICQVSSHTLFPYSVKSHITQPCSQRGHCPALFNPDPNPHHSFSSNHAQSSLSANQLYPITLT